MVTRHATILFALLVNATLTAAAGSAQIIPIRTVPVASGDQFLMLPSSTLAMGGVRVAVDDSVGAGWTNPAQGVMAAETLLFSSPTFYSISGDEGGGRTFPVGGVLAGARWFAGAALSLQQIDNPSPQHVAWSQSFGGPQRLTDESARNLYASGYIGRRIGGLWSVGIGLSASQLHAIDGADILYDGAERIEQSGGAQDVRVGLYRDGPTDRVSLLLVHSRLSMEHRVSYTGWAYDPTALLVLPDEQVEKNEEETRTWGAQLGWSRDLAAPGWRLGAAATVNRKTHPKIPDYDLQSLPRDPGTTWAYEGAVGIARAAGPTTFGMDVAFQPIWSKTWQEADAVDVVASGGAVREGEHSVDNDFLFTNVMMRAGISHRLTRATLQAGLEARSYSYQLTQVDYVRATDREQNESWMEWTPSVGVLFAFASFDVWYVGRLTAGTGRPGLDSSAVPTPTVLDTTSGGDFLVAPQGPLTLLNATVTTHQIAIRVPVR